MLRTVTGSRAAWCLHAGIPAIVKADDTHSANTKAAVPPVVVELKAEGFSITSVSDLVNGRAAYDASAVPILLKWLPRVNDPGLKEEIVRALTDKLAKPAAAKPLIKEFEESTDSSPTGLRWAIGNALSVVADDSVFDDLVQLLRSSEYGRAREMLPLAFANMKRPDAVGVLIDSLADEDLSVQVRVIKALGKLRAKDASKAIQPFTKRRESWIRKEAQTALKRIAKT